VPSLLVFKEKNMFISDAFAQTAGAAAANSTTGMIVQLVLIFVIFYFILIRPQQKKIREHEAMLNAIKKGDKVITGGGIYGVVEKANEDKLDVKIAEGITVVVHRATVRDVVDEKIAMPVAKTEKVSKNKKK
jgi:preprotein translocase subunit YajC